MTVGSDLCAGQLASLAPVALEEVSSADCDAPRA